MVTDLRPIFPSTLGAIIVALLTGGPLAQETGQGQPCVENREELLALDQQTFDQTPDAGWRPIAAQAGCKAAAAGLIREYRERAVDRQTEEQRAEEPGRFDILFWHEGQLRAIAGETAEALPLFRRAYGDHSSRTWIPYAEATIAFLERDRKALENAREALLSLEAPSDWDDRVRETKAQHGFEMTWPPNLNIVEALLRCFDEPYRKAYSEACGT